MEISVHTIAIETFVPMLRALSEILDQGAQYAKNKNFDPAILVNARLAPDMYPLVKQVQLACEHAKDSTARMIGHEPPRLEDNEERLDQLKARIAQTIDYLSKASAAAFEGAADRAIKIPIPNDGAIEMNGFQFLRDWALPHFYFHVVTAYDILRHSGVEICKRDYLSRVAVYVRQSGDRKA